jgi:hypothetical protein
MLDALEQDLAVQGSTPPPRPSAPARQPERSVPPLLAVPSGRPPRYTRPVYEDRAPSPTAKEHRGHDDADAHGDGDDNDGDAASDVPIHFYDADGLGAGDMDAADDSFAAEPPRQAARTPSPVAGAAASASALQVSRYFLEDIEMHRAVFLA